LLRLVLDEEASNLNMSGFNLFDYAPIGVMFIVALGFAASQILVTQLIGPRKRTAVKLMPYEWRLTATVTISAPDAL
jgi:hypothetical protein